MIDAEKREKVIRGLIACKNHWCAECSYAMPGMKCCGRDQMFDDAITLLQEQESRLMTLKEVEKTEEWMWVEYVSGYCGWQWQDKEDNYLNMVAWNDSTFDRKDYYGKTWRCWTSRPSDEQRAAVPWKEDRDAEVH